MSSNDQLDLYDHIYLLDLNIFSIVAEHPCSNWFSLRKILSYFPIFWYYHFFNIGLSDSFLWLVLNSKTASWYEKMHTSEKSDVWNDAFRIIYAMYVHLVPPQAAGIVILSYLLKPIETTPATSYPLSLVSSRYYETIHKECLEGVETSQNLGAVVAPLSRGKKKTLTGSPKSARSKKWIR